MEAQSIKEYEQLEKYYWWFVGRRRIIEGILKKYFFKAQLRILDWGCGPGGNFQFLKKYGQVLGVDASDEAIRACKEKGIQNVIKAGDLNEFKSDIKFDLATNFDVLEHIQEDEKFLSDLRKFLIPGGYVLVTIPAYRFLWSGLDEVLGHKRRYTKKEICRKFRRSGYEITMASYFIFFLCPAFIGYRMFQKIKKSNAANLSQSVFKLPKIVNWLFTKILSLEALIIPRLNLPFGTSIIVLAKSRTK